MAAPSCPGLVEEAFAADGALARAMAQAGRACHFNPAQAEYARRVALTFASGRGGHGATVSLLEGECGLGKTLGYMVPMALYCALNGRRGLVSLPPAAVTDPHYAAELDTAIAVAHALTGKRLGWARRFSAGGFLSPGLVETFRAALPPRREDLAAAMACLERACGESRLLADVLRDHGPLPPLIRTEEMSDGPHGAAYLAHLEAAQAADILLAPHSLLAGQGDLAMEPFACAVVDGADRLTEAGRIDWTLIGADSLCLTSAMLNEGGDPGLYDFRRRTGLDAQVREDLSGSLAMPRFGALTFNLSHPAAPRPTVTGVRFSKDNSRNPLWYDYVEGVLAEVALQGQRTLVLTCSHEDTAELARRLRGQGAAVISYLAPDRRDEVLAAFAADPAAMLIGASLWEEIDLPGMVRHLVVTRLPIPGRAAAPAAPEGVSAGAAEAAALDSLMREARRRLRFGLGRAIRSAGDDGHVWITDPRFPLPASLADNPRLQLPPGDPAHRAFSACIPERFRAGLYATYPQAALIDPDTRAPSPPLVRPPRRQARH